MNTKIKRLSFRIDIPEGYNPDSYISDGIQRTLDDKGIGVGSVLNITEKDRDGIYTIISYYKRKD